MYISYMPDMIECTAIITKYTLIIVGHPMVVTLEACYASFGRASPKPEIA